MRRRGAFFIILPLILGGFGGIHAQEDDSPIISDWDIYAPEFYTRGDQTFIITLGLIAPIIFLDVDGGIKEHGLSPPVGGTGTLSYNYFLNSHVIIGAEGGGMMISTKGQNMLYIVPIGARLGYQFVVRRFEFPLTLTVGIAPRKSEERDYLGMFIKGGGAVYYRFNPDWSFGLNTNWYWLPEWTSNSKTTTYGNIAEITLSARYHF